MGDLQVFSVDISFIIELQIAIHTFLLTYEGHKRLHSFSFTPTTKLKLVLVYYKLI
jgi:hypothetical protein